MAHLNYLQKGTVYWRMNKHYTINGIIQMCLSVFWIYHFARLLYLYQFSSILFLFRYPNWALLLSIFIGILGVLIGVTVLLIKNKIKNGYFQLSSLFILDLLLNYLIVQ